jgi:CARDB
VRLLECVNHALARRDGIEETPAVRRERTRWLTRCRWAVPAIVCATSAIGLTAATPTAAADFNGPDLVVKTLKPLGIGRPPVLVMEQDGSTQRFSVHVEVENVGRLAAGKSELLLKLKDFKGDAKFEARLPIEKLGKDDTQGWTIPIRSYEPSLGFISLKATADATNKVKESHEINNSLERRIAVVAQRWKVKQFQVEDDVPGATTTTTSTQPGFYFEFDGVLPGDEEFTYTAHGFLGSTTTYSGFCVGTGSAKPVFDSPWEDSDLTLGANLTQYDASISTHNLPHYKVPVVCAGAPPQDAQVSFHEPLTFVGRATSPKMRPDYGSLSGNEPDLGTHSTFTWVFDADVPPDRTS